MSDQVYGPSPPSQAPMFYYAYLGDDGLITSVGYAGIEYPPAIASSMGAVTLTQDQYEMVRSSGRWDWNDGAPVLVVPPPPPLAEVQARATLLIDAAAEMARTRFLTPGSGQALEYQATQADATRALGAEPPLSAQDYPWLEAERMALAAAGVETSLHDVADLVLQQQAAWTQVGAAIKSIRRAAKLQVAAATTASEVEAVLAALSWPSTT